MRRVPMGPSILRWTTILLSLVVALLADLGAGHAGRPRSLEAELDRLYGGVDLGGDRASAVRSASRLWSSNGSPRSQVGDLLSAIEAAGSRGLVPTDYDLARLEEGWQAAGAGELAAEELDELDRATSRAFLALLADLHYGRINPRRLGIGFELPRAGYDFAAVVRSALEQDRIAQAVAEAEPRFFQYAELKAALLRYRELANNPVLTAQLPAGRIVPGDEYAGVPRLAARLAALGDLPESDLPKLVLPIGGAARWLRPPPDPATGGAPTATTYSGPIVEALKRFQERHGLDADGIIGSRTWMALNAPMSRRVRQIELALERLRWLPEMKEGPFLLVNVPAFRLYGYESPAQTDTPSLQMKVVVGKATVSGTPVFSDEMRYIVFRPYWYPPRSIIRDEIVKEIEADPQYLEKHDMEIVAGAREDVSAVVPTTPESIGLLRSGDFLVRQRPGPKNSLGRIKFIFPNSHAVYLHDTPSRSLFVRQRRDFSHGCVRVQDPVGLARFVLRDQPEWTEPAIRAAMDAEKRRTVTLKRPVPVYIIYATAMARGDGTVLFYEDIYGRDAELERALREQRQRSRAERGSRGTATPDSAGAKSDPGGG